MYSMLGSGPFVTQATIVLGEDGRGTFQITNPFGFPFSSEALLAVGSCEGNAQRLTLLTATVFGAYVEMNQTISAPEDSGGSCRMENGFSSVEGSASFTIVFTKAPER